MKKIFTLILGITIAYSCSTSSDENGNITAAPVPPSNLTGIVASSTQINLSWTDNSTNETGFKIERKTGSGTYAVVGTTATDVSTFNDTGLNASTTYTYRVYSYNAGGNSQTFSNEISLTTFQIIVPGVPGPNVTDIDGNIYNTITNCNSTWMTSNLNVSKYKNGDIIPYVSISQWGSMTTGAWCYYNNDPTTGAIYGKLYNGYAVKDPRGLAPSGYHIPSDSEWTSLINCLGGDLTASLVMKEPGTSHWQSPNTGATNISGFKAIAGGFGDSGATSLQLQFININIAGYWWSSTWYGSTASNWIRGIYSNDASVKRFTGTWWWGYSVRCVKD